MKNEFVDYICEVLKVEPPSIHIIDSFPSSSTMMARITENGKRMEIKKGVEGLDLFFAIAHELRHSFQKKNGYIFPKKEQLDIESYNLQAHEIDANAFALIIMECCFDRTPLFNGLSEEVVRLIRKRAEVLRGIYFKSV